MEEKEKLKPGDVVGLKSEGPTMTISERRPDGLFRCVWFVINQMYEANFSEAALVKRG